jgi:PAS domain S-box-containing protein
MRFVKARRVESTDLKSSISLAIILAIYTLAIHLIDAFRSLMDERERYFHRGTLMYCLVLWLLGILWIAYRRWKKVSVADAELENIIDTITPDAFVVIDENRFITMCNDSIGKMFGFTPAELLGRTTEVLYADRRVSTEPANLIHDQLNRVGFHVGLATGRHKDGHAIPIEIVSGTIRDRRGAVLLIRDVSLRVKAEEAHREKADLLAQIEANFKKLKETEAARDNLMDMIVHDMKSPLQVIQSTLSILKSELASGKGCVDMAYVDEAVDQTSRLTEMVGSLLDVSLFEAGDVPLNMSGCDLRVLAKRAVSSLSLVSNRHSISVRMPQEPVHAVCDEEIIRRVVVNLLVNAIHHTPAETQIQLVVARENGHIQVEVADDGPGIAPEHHDRIFTKFSQIRDPGKPRKGSSGIGLAFCKLAIEAHGGRIGVESAPGRGSRFWFALPTVPGSADPAEALETVGATV